MEIRQRTADGVATTTFYNRVARGVRWVRSLDREAAANTADNLEARSFTFVLLSQIHRVDAPVTLSSNSFQTQHLLATLKKIIARSTD
jgi:hypothetical protein